MANILVIDDDDALRAVMRRALERDGHSVVDAAEGSAGLDLYRRAPTDVVITDLFMPGQDGIETIQMLRDEFPDARIIAISGGASSGEMGPLTDARLLGADVALPKPFAMAALGRAVRALVERGAAAGDETFETNV